MLVICGPRTPRPSPASCRSFPMRISSSSLRPKDRGRQSPWLPPLSPSTIPTRSWAASPPIMRCRTRSPSKRPCERRSRPPRPSWLVTIGLTPTRPETGYGYIERSDDSSRSAYGKAYRAVRFIEKPSPGGAEKYVATGRFLWNASMFVWRAQTLLDELEDPTCPAAADRRIAQAWGTSARSRCPPRCGPA